MNAPSWSELRDRHAASELLNVSGALDYRYVKHDGSLDEGSQDFWHGSGDRWRIERDGMPIYIRNGDVAFVRHGDHMRRQQAERTQLAALLPISPLRVVGGNASILSSLSSDLSPRLQAASAIDGRNVWPVELARAKDDDPGTALTFDDETGLIVGLTGLAGKLTAAVKGIQLHAELPDTLFEWDGEVEPTPIIEVMDADETRQLHAIEVTAPRFWPTGVGYSRRAGNSDTGELVLSLEVEGYPILARWPLNTNLTLLDPRLSSGYAHTVEWSDDVWHWRLITRTELTPEDLRRIRSSMRDS
ncbi:hypothetical protein [Rhodococcus koreensis]